MIDDKLLGLIPFALFLLHKAVTWLMRRTGALDRSPPQIDGRRIFRRHPATFLTGALICSAIAMDKFFAEGPGGFALAFAAIGAIYFSLLSQRFVLMDDQLEMQIFGRTWWRVAPSDIARVRPGGVWRQPALVRQAGKELALPADMAGLTWLTDRIARRNAVQSAE